MLLATTGGASAEKLYVDDVFSTYLYTGNGSTQTITNGIDLAGKGGMVWIKGRSGSYGTSSHALQDTAQGIQYALSSDWSYGVGVNGDVTSVLTNGFTLGATNRSNGASTYYASWTFRKAAKFFDVVTYTGDGVSGRQIPHSLGVAPGMITTKSTSTTGDWNSYHISASGDLKLNTGGATAPTDTSVRAIINSADATTFTVSGVANASGVSYVSYLWAHDNESSGLVKCGSFIANQGVNIVELGFEPQMVIFARTDGSPFYGSWYIADVMRGMSETSSTALLLNTSDAETGFNNNPLVTATSTGFKINFSSPAIGTNVKFIYLAIRRPNKPPTSGTEVFAPDTFYSNGSGSSARSYSFPPDAVFAKGSRFGTSGYQFTDRLRGFSLSLDSTSTFAEQTTSLVNGTTTSNTIVSANGELAWRMFWIFRRAPGFFDVVCTTSVSSANVNAHNLGVVPELIISKYRNLASQWYVFHKDLNGGVNPENFNLNLNGDSAAVLDNFFDNAPPTASQFSTRFVSTYTGISYLFATLPGISKVGSYTGNGSSQTINCGFSTGARFILIKRTDSTGDWYVWDSARGIIAANDPHLSLNTTAAEVTTDDSVDPTNSGFIVNQVAATNINVTSATYIYLAIA